MIPTIGYAAFDATSPLRLWNFERRDLGTSDIHIQILFCGVCHSDLHTVKAEWSGSTFPQVPGHEIIGRVVATGNAVTAHKAGDLVGVGCLVDSCRTCSACAQELEQYCENGSTGTYGGTEKQTGRPTQVAIQPRLSSTNTSCCAYPTESTLQERLRYCARALQLILHCANGVQVPACELA
jgi:alcohol dehydrogenase (NADP+)